MKSSLILRSDLTLTKTQGLTIALTLTPVDLTRADAPSP